MRFVEFTLGEDEVARPIRIVAQHVIALEQHARSPEWVCVMLSSGEEVIVRGTLQEVEEKLRSGLPRSYIVEAETRGSVAPGPRR